MFRDAANEIITHFIGLFELGTEAARLRLAHEEFTYRKALQDTPTDLMLVKVVVSAPFDPQELPHSLRYAPSGQESVAPLDYFPLHYGPLTPVYLYMPMFSPRWDAPLPLPPGPDMNYIIQIEPPSSLVAILYQSGRIIDLDVMNGEDFGAPLVPFEHLNYQLAELILDAGATQIFPTLELPADEAALHTIASDLFDAAQQAELPDAGSAGSAAMFRGPEVSGLHENGVSVEELAKLDDAMPALLATPEDEASEDPIEGVYDVSTGGNTLVNEVALGSSWLVSPVMAVGGDAISLAAITQTNIWNDADQIFGVGGMTHRIDAAATQAMNLASVTLVTTTDPEASVVSASGQLPSSWVVTRIDGNQINFNWVQQSNFMLDHDIASITLQGRSSFIEFGGNMTLNSALFTEMGFGYDLIVVGGNLINVSVIQQTNIMFDGDIVYLNDSFGGALSTGENLLWNYASIHAVGAKAYQPVTSDYQKALDQLSNGNDDPVSGVLSDSLFAGLGALRVLYIEGDLINLQYIEQINVLGDADQVAFMANETLALAGEGATLTTGSNALINVASIAEYGVDAQIYLGGDLYSDALLVQAELISDDVIVAGDPAHSPLASEAVVFLADGFLSEDEVPEYFGGSTAAADGPPSDPMQSMLS
ncbi:hypothetical protein [Phaeovulum sp.]|uniref:hypothetical protein n=1 Tax=Phaeovulum sp. TaxID=2934796 RepID=UPI00356AA26C